jgi:uncharacterized iron-regulated membrane protein
LNHPAWQKVWLRIHWCLGLFAGLVFVLSGATGSTLVFYQAIDEWLNPERLTVAGNGPYRSFDEMASAARTARPDVPGPYGIFLPQDDVGVVVAWFKTSDGEPNHVLDVEVAIDPYSAKVLSRDRIWGKTLVSFVYELHKGLLLEKVGETLVGFFALLLILSIATGLYLWWPKPGRYRQAVSFNPHGSPIRRHYDLHKLTGLTGSLLLLVLAFTGLYLEFPGYVVPLVGTLSSVPEETALISIVNPEARPIPIDQAVAIAKEFLPAGELKWIGLPQQADEAFQIGLRQPGEVRSTSGESIVWLDQYSGAVLKVRDWRRITAGETFLAWLFPLHNGEAFGVPGRILVCITGLVPLVLYVTALRMWWLKRMAHRQQQSIPLR